MFSRACRVDEAPVEFDTERIMYNLVLKNQVVLGVVNAGPQAFDNAVRDIGVFAARGRKRCAP